MIKQFILAKVYGRYVHMQNNIRFTSKLEDANKTFEFMIYPNGRHGWGGEKQIHSTNESHRFWLKYFIGK